jgi:hypothetical protein
MYDITENKHNNKYNAVHHVTVLGMLSQTIHLCHRIFGVVKDVGQWLSNDSHCKQ